MNGKGTEAQIHGFNVNKILNPYITYISDSARKASDSLVNIPISTIYRNVAGKKCAQ